MRRSLIVYEEDIDAVIGRRRFVEDNLARWKGLFQELVRIPSTFESEHEITEKVGRYIESLGLSVAKVPHAVETLRTLVAAQRPFSNVADRNSLVARVPGHGAGRSLVINTHLDTVPEGDRAAWKHDPYSGHIDQLENVLYGRGAMDDKAGLTVSLAVLETLSRWSSQLAGDVIFQYVLEDEITGNGSLLCLEAGFTGDAALIMDGTRPDRAINQHAGQLQFQITLKGKAASVSVSHMGVNAAEMMARLVIHLRDVISALNAERIPPWTQFPSPYQLVLQSIQSQGAQLTVPEAAVAQCYVTFPPQFTLTTLCGLLKREVDAFAATHALPNPPRLDWNGFATEPVQSDTRELETFLQQSAARLRMEPIAVGPSTGTSDMRHFSSAGIPCLLYGPGRGYNPHRPDEHYYLDDLPQMILFYVDLASAWCGNAQPPE